MNEQKEKIVRFIRFLKKASKEDNRGVLADLRRGFSEATETRVWPHLGRFCKNDREWLVFRTVAACYATNPLNDDSKNFGASARRLSDKLSSFETAFKRLLNCRRPEDVCERLRSFVLAMKSKGVAVNWKRLTWDLLCWNNRVKSSWAAQFWPYGDFAAFKEAENAGEADAETEDEGGDE